MDWRAFWEGALAGYGIAVPVGAIAILIVDAALRRGFAFGFMAGAGAASADLFYAGLAAVAGHSLAASLAPAAPALRLFSAGVLLALGAWGLRQTIRRPPAAAQPAPAAAGSPWRTYVQFTGLTLLNPLTVVYFGSLILGNGAGALQTANARLLFVAGAGLASLSWQSLLAVIGALAHRRLSPQLQRMTSLLGNLIVIALGLRILWRL